MKNIMCNKIKGPHFLETNNSREKLGQVWFYILRKDFCQIPRTQEDQILVDQIVAKNYLRLININGIKDIDYFGELTKYYLINSDKIFAPLNTNGID